MPGGVLFVCHGNICRSPYAAAVFRSHLGPHAAQVIRVRSAGFVGPTRPAPRHAVDEAAARGIDLREHRSHRLTAQEVRAAELVVVMEPRQVRPLRDLYASAVPVVVLADLDPEPDGGRVIVDPVDQPRAVFAASYDRIDRCVVMLSAAVAG